MIAGFPAPPAPTEGDPAVSESKSSYRVVAPDRYLRAVPAEGPVTVSLRGRPVARSESALELLEGDRPGVHYLPRADVAPAGLVRSERSYACRWKGDATYFHVHVGDRRVEDGAWEYAAPPAELAELAGHVAFDASRFDVEPVRVPEEASD